MSNLRRAWRAVACATITAAAFADGLSVFKGTPGGVGDVIALDPTVASTAHVVAGLGQVQLLAFDYSGHSALSELASGVGRLRNDVPGGARLVLPQASGALFHFLRSDALGDHFGWFVVDPSGLARELFELSVATGAADPFLPRVAVSRDGARVLAATNVAAGGALFDIDVASGTTIARTQGLPPFDFGVNGLAVGANFGIAAHASGVLRFDRATSSVAQPISFPNSPTWFGREVVLSTNGQFAATIAGADATLADVYGIGSTGAAVLVSTSSSLLSGAGFEPDAQDGPYLAISDDGTTAAWRLDGVKREAFIAHLQAIPGEQPNQITSDANFLDTLDEVGLYGFRPGTATLLLGVGKQATPGVNALDVVDIFGVDFPSGGAPQYTNITLSSGDGLVPFLSPPKIKPIFAQWIESANSMLILDGAQDTVISATPGVTGFQVIDTGVKSIDSVEVVGGTVVATISRTKNPKTEDVLRLDGATLAKLGVIASFASGDVVDRFAVRADGWLGFVQTAPNAEFVWAYGAASAQLKLLTTRPLHYGPTIGFAGAGELAFDVGALNAPALFATWNPGGAAHRIPIAPPGPGFVLSAN